MMRYNRLNLGIFGGEEENVLHTAMIDCQDRAQFGLVIGFYAKLLSKCVQNILQNLQPICFENIKPTTKGNIIFSVNIVYYFRLYN